MAWKKVCTGFENKGICAMCGGKLGKGRRCYCNDECAELYNDLFLWSRASSEAVKRANRKCQRCGITGDGYWKTHRDNFSPFAPSLSLEVHHIIPLNGHDRTWHPLNTPDNLLVLCHDCHVLLHTPSKLKQLEHAKMQPVLI